MSSITIIVPAAFLARPAVARAVADLTLALGGHDTDEGTNPSTVVDVTAYAATSAAADQGGASDADAAPATLADDIAVPAPVAAAGDDALRARWEAYTAGLTDNARRFLALLEKRGRLTILEAVKLLGLPGKAVGGIVGTIGRWTPKHGFAVPFSVNENASARVHKAIFPRAAWERAIAAAEIKDFRFHDLRHSTASYLAMQGASLVEIADVLGHKTLQMVKRFSHLSEAHTRGVVDRMNEKIFGGGLEEGCRAARPSERGTGEMEALRHGPEAHPPEGRPRP